jgi:hypothetical protein
VELYDPANAYGRLNTYPSAYYQETNAISGVGEEPSIRARDIYIPINTWFTLDSRCAFPLVALQYNELYITVTLRPIQELFQVRDVSDFDNRFPYIKPDFNLPQFNMYKFLQSPPCINVNYVDITNSGIQAYTNQINVWNTDVHIMSTYCFLSKDEASQFAAEDQIYLIKDVFQYGFENITGTQKVSLPSSGMVANWMWYLQRNDVQMRNEWSNYTNWPYRTIPVGIIPAPSKCISTLPVDISSNAFYNTWGPFQNPNKTSETIAGINTGYYYTTTFQPDNQFTILETMGILLNGDYRENVLTSGIYEYVEKYTRTPGFASEGIYCYNFCLNTSPYEYQPSGAINLSKFRTIELEITTYVPQFNTVVDPTAAKSNIEVICDGNGNVIGITKLNWKLYEYNFNMTLFEERYNVLSFIGGNCGMLYAR